MRVAAWRLNPREEKHSGPTADPFVGIDEAAPYALPSPLAGGHRAPDGSGGQRGQERFILPEGVGGLLFEKAPAAGAGGRRGPRLSPRCTEHPSSLNAGTGTNAGVPPGLSTKTPSGIKTWKTLT